MPNLDNNEFTPFDGNRVSLEFLGNHKTLWNLAGRSRVPELATCFGLRKAVQKRSDTKEMVAAACVT